MATETIRNIRLGIFVLAGIIFLVIALYFIGDNRNMFGSTYTLNANFRNVSGLQPGNNVRFAGIDVGTVDKIIFENDTLIKVEMLIDEEMGKIIRKNSIAYIGTDGLMGNRLVNIEPGKGDSPVAADGDVLRSIQPVNMESMLRTLEYTNENVATISDNLRNITQNLMISKGTMLAMLTDTAVAVSLRNTIGNVEEVSAHLGNLSENLDRMIGQTADGKGLAGALFTDTALSEKFRRTVEDVSEGGRRIAEASLQLNEILDKANAGDGTLGMLLNDSVAANNIRSGIQSLKSASEKLDENMEALQHNFLLRGYFKRKR